MYLWHNDRCTWVEKPHAVLHRILWYTSDMPYSRFLISNCGLFFCIGVFRKVYDTLVSRLRRKVLLLVLLPVTPFFCASLQFHLNTLSMLVATFFCVVQKNLICPPPPPPFSPQFLIKWESIFFSCCHHLNATPPPNTQCLTIHPCAHICLPPRPHHPYHPLCVFASQLFSGFFEKKHFLLFSFFSL